MAAGQAIYGFLQSRVSCIEHGRRPGTNGLCKGDTSVAKQAGVWNTKDVVSLGGGSKTRLVGL